MRPLIHGLGALALAGALLAGCGDDDEAAAETFCEEVEAVQARFAELGTAAVPDPAVFDDVSEAFDDLADAAPEEIEGDMASLAAALATLAEIFEDVDLTDPASLRGLQDQAAELQEQAGDVEEASANVQAYLEEECGIDLGDAVPLGPGTEGDGRTEEGTEGSG